MENNGMFSPSSASAQSGQFGMAPIVIGKLSVLEVK